MNITDLIQMARADQCSDLHITAGTAVAVRRFGALKVLDVKPSLEESEQMIYSLLSPQEIQIVNSGKDIDVAITDESKGRLRINVYHQRNHLAASIRLLEQAIPSLEEIGLAGTLRSAADLRSGMILITGPTGSGKSTTLASFIDYINANKASHIITVEDPIEYLFDHKQAMIHQRQLGTDVPDFSTALRSSLREDPDVIMVGEMRDYETISAAITAAETGHLVLSTLHTKSATQTVERIISSCPIEVRDSMLLQFANVLSLVVTQELVPKSDGTGRVAATEVMVNTRAVSNLIKERKTSQINTAIQAGRQFGMHTLNSSLSGLVDQRIITRDTALIHSNAPDELKKIL